MNWLLTHFWSIESVEQAILIGVIWLALTVAFEFIFGHYVLKKSWTKLLDDYNIFAGKVWVLVLIWIAIAPFLFYNLNTHLGL